MLTTLLYCLAACATPQVLAYDLDAGEVVFSDTATSAAAPAIRILAHDGSVRTVYEGGRLNYPSGVLIDRDGSILVVDYHGDGSSTNRVLRLPPSGGQVEVISNAGLNDCFMLTRGPLGQLYVSDGYSGVVEVLEDGAVVPFSGSGNPFSNPIAFGLDLRPGGEVLLAEAPTAGSTPPGSIWQIAADGTRSLLVSDPLYLRSPQDLAFALDGSIFVTHFDQYESEQAPRLVRLRPNASAKVVHDGLPLRKPKGVAVGSTGAVYIADTDAQAIFRWTPTGGMEHLVGDLDDGIDDGMPLNRPFGLAVVPDLWLRAERGPVAGESIEIVVESVPALGSHPVAIFASNLRSEFALKQIWAGAPGLMSLDPMSADQINFTLAPMGNETHVSRTIPAHMAGLALHLQALEPLKRLPSAALSFRVN